MGNWWRSWIHFGVKVDESSTINQGQNGSGSVLSSAVVRCIWVAHPVLPIQSVMESVV